jgi:hypothetical protein
MPEPALYFFCVMIRDLIKERICLVSDPCRDLRAYGCPVAFSVRDTVKKIPAKANADISF